MLFVFVRNALNVKFFMKLFCVERSSSCGPFLSFSMQTYKIGQYTSHSAYLSNWNLYFFAYFLLQSLPRASNYLSDSTLLIPLGMIESFSYYYEMSYNILCGLGVVHSLFLT